MDLRDGIPELMEGGSEFLWQCNRVSGPKEGDKHKGFHKGKPIYPLNQRCKNALGLQMLPLKEVLRSVGRTQGGQIVTFLDEPLLKDLL